MEGDKEVEEGEEGEALMDLPAAGIVCKKIYEESESCVSAAHFHLAAAINAGKADEMEGGSKGEIGPELEFEEEGGVLICLIIFIS